MMLSKYLFVFKNVSDFLHVAEGFAVPTKQFVLSLVSRVAYWYIFLKKTLIFKNKLPFNICL